MRTIFFSDGVTTQAVNDRTVCTTTDYTMAAPAIDYRRTTEEMDGGEQTAAWQRNIDEQIILHCSTLANARSVKNTLDRLFDAAHLRGRLRVGRQVWMQYRADGAEAIYRSEVLSGKASFTGDLSLDIVVTITRRFYWETDAVQSLTLDNGVTSGTSLTVKNSAGALYSNWVRISAGQITGSIKAPVLLTYQNNYASATRTTNIMYASFAEVAGTYGHRIEGESGTMVGTGSTGDASASGGTVARLTWSGTGEVTAWYGAIPQATLVATGGGKFKVLAMIKGANVNDIRIRARLSYDLLSERGLGSWVTVPQFGGIVDLGEFRLPPGSQITGAPYPITLELHTRRNAGGSISMDLDYIYLMPADSIRKLNDGGFSLAQGTTITDDPFSERVFVSGYAGGDINNYNPLGRPVVLTPGVDNVVYFAVAPLDNYQRSGLVTLSYRPRRLQI